MDEPIIEVVVRLIRVHEALGDTAFRSAARAALVAIGRSVLDDAEGFSAEKAEVKDNVLDLTRYARTRRAARILANECGDTE